MKKKKTKYGAEAWLFRLKVELGHSSGCKQEKNNKKERKQNKKSEMKTTDARGTSKKKGGKIKLPPSSAFEMIKATCRPVINEGRSWGRAGQSSNFIVQFAVVAIRGRLHSSETKRKRTSWGRKREKAGSAAMGREETGVFLKTAR